MSLSRLFAHYMENDKDFREASEIVLANSLGKAWLVGGAVYRSLAFLLYRTERPTASDFDFIVEFPKIPIKPPEGLTLGTNSYGNPKFEGRFLIDYVPLATVNSITRRQVEPTIDNFLTGTPLTIQSIAYELRAKELLGEIGINAILSKTVGVNNRDQARIYEAKKGKPIEEIVKEKARSLGFTPTI